MTQNYGFTYVIGYRHKVDRLQTLKRVLDWINGFGGVEVLLIEQDKHSKISHLNIKAKHIFIKTNLPYNRSWSFNVALKNSNSNIIVFGDSDIIMDPNDFINGLNSIKNYDMVSPYHCVLDLTQDESRLQIEDMIKISRPGRGEAFNDPQKINICGGIAMFRKDAIYKIGGFCEDFIGWGGEDDLQTLKTKKFLSFTELKAKCYHLYHDRTQPDMKWYNRNLQLLQKFDKMSEQDLMKHINSTIPKIGMKNKYNNF